MQKVDHPRGKRRNVAFLLASSLIVAADQLSKTWIRSNLAVGESVAETEFFQITHVCNTGAVFGLFQGRSFALTVAAVAVIVLLLVYVVFISRRLPFMDNTVSKTALGLILGGAIGNLIDRLRSGCVTDFIDFGFWPAFNVADSAVTVGVIIFAVTLIVLTRDECL